MKTFLKITALAAITVFCSARRGCSPPNQPGPHRPTMGRLRAVHSIWTTRFPALVTVIWNVNIDPATPAQVTLNVFYNGGHHLAFGYNKLMLVSYVDGVYTFTGFEDSATATLNTMVNPATFEWRVALGVSCPNQIPYNSLKYFGVADRGGR